MLRAPPARDKGRRARGGYARACAPRSTGRNSRKPSSAVAGPSGSPAMAAGRQDIHQPVDHLPHVHSPLAAARLARRDQRLDHRSLRISQVAPIAQVIAAIAGAVLNGPHRCLPSPIGAKLRSHSRFQPRKPNSANRSCTFKKSPDGH